jgi:AraC-like DNA-binding protein
MNSEIVNAFDENRQEFKPYGLMCELWTPSLMKKADRHNEIEINYLPGSSITYLLHDKKITIPAKRLAIFWGLIPHQIFYFEETSPYYVCTIPFSQFLEWNLPSSFVDRILKGEVLLEANDISSRYDEYMLNNWIRDINELGNSEATILEMRARLLRMSSGDLIKQEHDLSPSHSNQISQVEKIAIYIARHYRNVIKVSDIGEAVGLNPDYANTIFKKTFGCTLNEYIIKERISHAQRKLVSTDTNITEIAFDCGFNSISRFNAAFLKINNCTPRQFRKRYL